MSYSTSLTVALASLLLGPTRTEADPPADAPPTLDDVLQPALKRITALVEAYRREPVSPLRTAQFENDLQQALREFGRITAEWTYNQLEPADVRALPPQVRFEGSSYRRLSKKTPQSVSTLFGDIRLLRLGYRAPASQGEPTLFPLCQSLGVVRGASPALLERMAHYLAEGGATQERALQRLRNEHGVVMGVKRLRQLTVFVSAAMEEQRAEAQAEQVVKWLGQAQVSRGRHRPVLSAGRDGISLKLRFKGGTLFEVAATGTLSVYDRRGKRVGTVYLAQPPEPGQATMSKQLTDLLVEVLRRWQGPLPRLCYVTDAGDNETAYYHKHLRRLRHPVTGLRLAWVWVVDYYHASERLWTMAEALFGLGQRSWSWARRMQKLMLKPGGVGRVLHSAAAMRGRVKPTGKRWEDFQRAYRYLQQRRAHMRYHACRRVGLPIGSGVTEAACKTVFTQRLKLSGMHWHKAGALQILRLRVVLLSGVWSDVVERMLKAFGEVQVPSPARKSSCARQKAA
jgi:hypothetical protein